MVNMSHNDTFCLFTDVKTQTPVYDLVVAQQLQAAQILVGLCNLSCW